MPADIPQPGTLKNERARYIDRECIPVEDAHGIEQPGIACNDTLQSGKHPVKEIAPA
jgi:hypothetical protein